MGSFGRDREGSPASDDRPTGASAATITPYRDGPLLIRGDFSLVDQDGREIPNQRGTIALCRCGKSRMRPFCDGTHKLIGFKAPSQRENGRS